MKRLLKARCLFSLVFMVGCTNNTDSNAVAPQQQAAIIGGLNAQEGDPVLLSTLHLKIGHGDDSGYCSATLVSPNLAITAAHCVVSEEGEESPLHYTLGKGLNIEKGSKSYNIEVEGVLQDGFTGSNVSRRFDIAVIKLKEKVSGDLKPVPLIASRINLKPGIGLILAGYGSSGKENYGKGSLLRFVDAKVQDFFDGEFDVDQTNGKGSCYGDSGGPAYVQTEKGLALLGVVSGPSRRLNQDPLTGGCSLVITFSDVTEYKEFILESAKKLNAIPPQFVE